MTLAPLGLCGMGVLLKASSAELMSERILNMRFTLFCPIMLLVASNALWAEPQKCPTETIDVPITITGTLEYHSGVYAWYGVHLAKPACGQEVLQIGFDDKADFREAHRYLGCQITVTGNLFAPDTGSWSVPLGITEAHVQPVKVCKLGEPLPDYSAVPIPSALDRYKVVASYDPRTFEFSAKAYDASSGKPLSPWQTYASDIGNGAHDLQRMFCADGFVASDPKDAHGQPDLRANIDPGSPQALEVAILNDSIVELSFVCTLSPSKTE